MNNNKKTGRKNNTKQIVTLPTTDFFTHKELMNINQNMIKITLRTKIKKQLEDGKINDIGVMHNGKGRPTNVYSLSPVTSNVIEKAKAAGVILHSEYLSQKVADITQKTTQSSEFNTSKVTQTVKTTAVSV